MKLFLSLSFAALAATSAMAETNALECKVLSEFFALYEAKAAVADADRTAVANSVPLVFEEGGKPGGLDEALSAAGYDPEAIKSEIVLLDQFKLVLGDRCGE